MVLSLLFTKILIVVTTIFVVILTFFHNRYKYWTKKGIHQMPPRIPFGNNDPYLPKGFTLGIRSKVFYDYFKSKGLKFGGVYLVTEPNLVIVDPEYIKDILSKDFQYFVDRGFYFNKADDPISANLFTVDGTEWKNLRVKLTPTFTSSKMKAMFFEVKNCCNNMLEAVDKPGTDIDIKEIMGRYTTDVIGSCAFGIECNSFKHPDAEFRMMGHRIFYFDLWRSIRAFCIANVPKLSRLLHFTSNNKDVRDFFVKLVVDTVDMRKQTQNRRNDFLQILIDMKESVNLSMDEMAAQVFLFFQAGFETSATTMSFALYELARSQEYQERLRKEISTVLEKYNNEITYESLSEMTYLNQVFEETLRLYPPGTTLNRRCTQDYTLHDTNIVLKKGTSILISPFGLHRDPEFYPEPEKFDPQRFSEDVKKNRDSYAYLPFGDGPRNCIGSRFGAMQSKIGIASVIKNFKVTVSSSTRPIELDPHRFLLSSINPIYLRAERVS